MSSGDNVSKGPDREFMLLAIEEARKSEVEDERVHPMVGVVVVKDGNVLATGHRGEGGGGAHAEFVALELKLKDSVLVGAIIFTTLEPCTSRNHPKVPCAERIREHRLGKVVYGIIDPDEKVHGRGELLLRDSGVLIARFDSDLMPVIEELNRDFLRSRRKNAKANSARPLTEVAGEHSARGKGKVIGLDIQGPAIIKPGTKVSAEGEGNITGTRIGPPPDP